MLPPPFRPYFYRKIYPWQMRLLRIPYGEDLDPMVVILVTVNLVITEGVALEGGTEAVPYDALFYTWGSANTYSIILLDGLPFTITLHLAAALVAYR
jgi:hypothetical protein